MKDFVVYRLDIAHELMKKGCNLKNIGINKNNPRYNVYYFENTAKVKEIVDEFIKK